VQRDIETKMISTPAEIADRDKANFDDAPWWENAFNLSALAIDKNKKGRQQSLQIFDLEQEGSVKTIHNKNKKKPAVSFLVKNYEEDDSASSSSPRSLSSDNHTNKATGKTPSPMHASTSVVSPMEVGDGSSSAVSG